ncbi:hypothetical protein D3C74_313460 [compost metagenome]
MTEVRDRLSLYVTSVMDVRDEFEFLYVTRFTGSNGITSCLKLSLFTSTLPVSSMYVTFSLSSGSSELMMSLKIALSDLVIDGLINCSFWSETAPAE